jgi:hypothetical protein
MTELRLAPPLRDLPWMRRQRIDSNIRRSIGELRALALEDTDFSRSYVAMAAAFEGAIELLDAISDWDTEKPGSVRVFL